MRILVLLTCLALAASCSRKARENGKTTFEDHGNPAGTTAGLTPDKNLSGGPVKGQFQADKTNPDSLQKIIFAGGCKVPGQPEPEAKLILNLPKSFVESSTRGNIKLITATKVISQDKTGFKLETTYQEASGIQDLKAGAKFEETCQIKIQNGQEYLDCEYSPKNLGLRNVLADTACSPQGAPTEQDLSSGTFTLQNKLAVKAFTQRAMFKGVQIKCGDKEFKGDFFRIAVSTNDLPSRTPKHCGGENIFIYEKSTDEKGQVIREGSYELLSIEK